MKGGRDARWRAAGRGARGGAERQKARGSVWPAPQKREKQIAPKLVGAEQENAVDALSGLDAHKMPVGRDQAEQIVGIAVDEQCDRQFSHWVRGVDQLESFGVAHALEPADMGPQGAVVEQRNPLRRNE